MSQYLKFTLIIVVLAIVGALIITTDNPTDQNTATPASSTDSSIDIPDNWEAYSNATYDFSIDHPPEATVQAEGIDEKRNIKFMYLGSSQATGEITDGFTLTVSTHHKDETQAETLKDFVDDEIQDSSQAAEILQQPNETSFLHRPAWEYQIESLGTVEVTAIETDDAYVTISSNTTDPNNRGYDEMVEQMKASLEFKNVTAQPEEAASQQESIDVAVLDINVEENETPDRGCDNVEMISRSVAETNTPLNAAMTELFSLQNTDVDEYYNFMAKTNDTLTFDRATIEGETANIYLNGELSGLVGVCDNPRAKIQIEETALQFASVSDVQIYLNGEETELQPGGQN